MAPSLASAQGEGSPVDTGKLSTCNQQSVKLEFKFKSATNPEPNWLVGVL